MLKSVSLMSLPSFSRALSPQISAVVMVEKSKPSSSPVVADGQKRSSIRDSSAWNKAGIYIHIYKCVGNEMIIQ